MCSRRRSPAPQPIPAPPPMMSRINPELKESILPKKKDLIDKDTVADVQYGSSKKEGSAFVGKKKGAEALRIALNPGGSTGAAGGGISGGTG